MSNKKIIPVKKESEIRFQAASWIAQLDSDDFTDADRIAFREWANRSPRHLAELKKMEALWHGIDALLSEEASRRFVSVPSFRQTLLAILKLRPTFFYKTVGVMMAIVFAIITVFAVSSRSFGPAPYEATFAVAEGEQRLYDLPDGSEIHLNTDSLVEIDFSRRERVVRLVRGEAHFDVATDETRPFLVHANGHIVKAVGTVFVVRVDANDTSVIVTEGIVELAALPKPSESGIFYKNEIGAAATAKLVAGQSANISETAKTAQPEIEIFTSQTIDRKLAWRKGLLIFDGESLAEVISEVSRYTRSQIVISDPEIRDLPIGGSFKAGEVDALLGALEASFGVKVSRVSTDLIYLSKVESL